MNGVIYARYSSDNQREESIEGQLRECQDFAEKNDITILNTYIDRAFSAKTDNRPEFQHMIADSKKKMFDVVLVWKYDRFARNRLDSLMYKQLLQRNDIKLISVTEPIMNSSVGIIVESMITTAVRCRLVTSLTRTNTFRSTLSQPQLCSKHFRNTTRA